MDWLKGILATIITGVVVWWLTVGISSNRPEPRPVPPPLGTPRSTPSQTNDDISGRYQGTANLLGVGPQGRFNEYYRITLNIQQTSSNGRFSGNMTIVYMMDDPGSGITLPINGQLAGDWISFQANNSGDLVPYFEGRFAFNSINGHWTTTGPGFLCG
jgi:hypothetical protein